MKQNDKYGPKNLHFDNPKPKHKEDSTYKKTTLNLFKKYSNNMENPWAKQSKPKNQNSKSVDYRTHKLRNSKNDIM